MFRRARRGDWRGLILTALRYALLTVTAVVLVLAPCWLVLVNSWKTFGEAQRLGFGLPTQWAVVENYLKVFQDAHMARGFVNSVVVTGTAIAFLLLLGAAAAWVFARSAARIDRVTYYFVVAGIILPPAVITTIALLKTTGLYGDHPGLVVFYVAAFLPFVIFLMTGFIRSIPLELEDAARIDGCSNIGVFVRIVLPLLRPILITSAILLLILIWNEFFWAFFVLKGSQGQTLPLGLYYVSSDAAYQTRWDRVFAHVVLVSLPLLVVYLFAQRRIIGGLTSGAIHG